jgi:ABC-type transporter Mla subunit MlaD
MDFFYDSQEQFQDEANDVTAMQHLSDEICSAISGLIDEISEACRAVADASSLSGMINKTSFALSKLNDVMSELLELWENFARMVDSMIASKSKILVNKDDTRNSIINNIINCVIAQFDSAWSLFNNLASNLLKNSETLLVKIATSIDELNSVLSEYFKELYKSRDNYDAIIKKVDAAKNAYQGLLREVELDLSTLLEKSKRLEITRDTLTSELETCNSNQEDERGNEIRQILSDVEDKIAANTNERNRVEKLRQKISIKLEQNIHELNEQSAPIKAQSDKLGVQINESNEELEELIRMRNEFETTVDAVKKELDLKKQTFSVELARIRDTVTKYQREPVLEPDVELEDIQH